MHAIYIQQRGIVDSRSLRYIFFCSSLSTLQFLQSTFASLLYKKGDYLNLAAGWMDRQYPRRQNMCICVDVDVYFFMPFFIMPQPQKT